MGDRQEFIDAVRAAAFETEDGRRVVHSTTMPPMILGADSDADGLIEEIDRAKDVQWITNGIQDDHALGVLHEDGRVRFYQVPQPAEAG